MSSITSSHTSKLWVGKLVNLSPYFMLSEIGGKSSAWPSPFVCVYANIRTDEFDKSLCGTSVSVHQYSPVHICYSSCFFSFMFRSSFRYMKVIHESNRLQPYFTLGRLYAQFLVIFESLNLLGVWWKRRLWWRLQCPFQIVQKLLKKSVISIYGTKIMEDVACRIFLTTDGTAVNRAEGMQEAEWYLYHHGHGIRKMHQFCNWRHFIG